MWVSGWKIFQVLPPSSVATNKALMKWKKNLRNWVLGQEIVVHCCSTSYIHLFVVCDHNWAGIHCLSHWTSPLCTSLSTSRGSFSRNHGGKCENRTFLLGVSNDFCSPLLRTTPLETRNTVRLTVHGTCPRTIFCFFNEFNLILSKNYKF